MEVSPTKRPLFRILGNSGLIAIGTALGQVFIFASTPFLARIYGPADFGRLALLMTITSFVMATGCLRYDMALPGATDEEVPQLYALCLAVGCVLAAAFGLMSFLPWGGWFKNPIMGLLSSPAVMILAFLGVPCFQAAGAFLIRQGRFAGLAGLRASQGLFASSLAFLPLFGLVWSHLLSFLFGGVVVLAVLLAADGASIRRLRPANLVKSARKFKKFPGYNLAGSILDAVGFSACVWIISSWFGLGEAGKYAQIQRLIGAPMYLASMSLGQVMLKHSADELRAKRPLWPVVKQVAGVLATFSALLLVVLYFGGSRGIRIFLGPRWDLGTRLICLIAATAFIRTIVSPLSTVLVTTQRFGAAFIWQVVYFTSTLVVLPLMAARMTFPSFILGYTIHEAIHYSIYFLIIRHVARGWVCAEFSV